MLLVWKSSVVIKIFINIAGSNMRNSENNLLPIISGELTLQYSCSNVIKCFLTLNTYTYLGQEDEVDELKLW